MAYQKDNTDWIAKERRELFAKAVNSMLMTSPEMSIKDALEKAKLIVDTAFNNYPDNDESTENPL